MFSSEAWLANTGADFYNDVATQSLRFDRPSTPYLVRTPSSASNRKTWTWSGWFKTTTLSVDHFPFFSCGASGSSFTMLFIEPANDRIAIYDYDGSTDYGKHYKVQIRDPSAWYHIQYAVDTTQSTASDRLKVYLNGTQLTSPYATEYGDMPLNYDTEMNNTVTQYIGKYVGNAKYADGYLSEVNFVDGTQLAPTSFGETKNGVWIPIKYSGSYGTNGYRLQFDQTGVGTASASTIGADTSGNNNHYTSSGIVASDCAMPDSPENNMCTLNPIGRRYGQSYVGTFSEGNLKFASGGNATNVFGSMAINQIASQGGVYFELRFDSIDSVRTYFGVIGDTGTNNTNAYSNSGGYTFPIKGMLSSVPRGYFTTDTDASNSVDLTANTAFSNGDVAGIAILSDGKFFVHRNGTYLNDASGNTGNPSTGANPIATIDLTLGDWFPYLGYSSSYSANFGQDGTFSGQETSGGNQDGNGIGDFMFAVPTNCLAISTSNMAEPTISPNADTQADDHFNTVIYSGNGTDDRGITGVGFKPDFVWLKTRNATDNHVLNDSSRGGNKQLFSNDTSQELTATSLLKTFNSDGFTLGTDNAVNSGSRTYVAWNWKANGGTTSSNSDGSITSTVQANTTAGFSIVLWNGEGDGQATVGHGLGVKPQVIIPKNRDATGNWHMYHEGVDSSAPEDYGILLNSSNARSNDAGFHNDTAPTSSVFTVGTYNNFNNDYVAYCFAEIEGYSKFGSYIGNGSTDGTFVALNFSPSFVLLKRTDATGYWAMWDTVRDVNNAVINELSPNASDAETTAAGARLDILSNGFKLRNSGVAYNASGSPIIYMAFAEAPFKYANAR